MSQSSKIIESNSVSVINGAKPKSPEKAEPKVISERETIANTLKERLMKAFEERDSFPII